MKMANTSSAKKMISVIKKRTVKNKAHKNRLKTIKKKCEKNIVLHSQNKSEETKKSAITSFNIAQKTIYQTSSKGIIHKNKASRLVSRLNKKLKASVLQG